MYPRQGPHRLGAALRMPRTLSATPGLLGLSSEPWMAGPGLQGSRRASPGLTQRPPASLLLRTAVAQPSVGTNTTENLGVTNGQYLNPWVRAQLPTGWSCTLWRVQTRTLPRPRTPHLLRMPWPLQRALCPPVSPPSRGPVFFMILSPLPLPRLWFLWKLNIPLPPRLPWSLKSRRKSRKGWFQFQRLL